MNPSRRSNPDTSDTTLSHAGNPIGRQIEVLGDENNVVPLKYHIVDNFKIQFGREEFCLVNGLKFGVENWADYNDEDGHEPTPFRRWMFSSSLDGKPIKGNMVLQVIKSKQFNQLHDDDVVSLCCEYYTRHKCHPRIVALSSNGRFFRKMVFNFFHVFGGYDSWTVRQAQPDPIIVAQHFGLRDLSGFQSLQGGPSTFHMPTNSSFFDVGQAGPSYGYNADTPTNWQTPMASATPYLKNPFPSHLGTSNWESQMPSQSANLNWQPPIQAHQHDDVLFNPNIMNRPRREHHPNIYRKSPYNDFPLSTVLSKKRGGKIKNKGKEANVSPYNLGKAFNDEDVEGGEVMIMGEQDTDCHMMGYKVPSLFWRQLVPHLCMASSHTLEPTYPDGWLFEDHMDAWIQLLIRQRPKNANRTLSKSGIVCVHHENNQFMIESTTPPYPTWKDVNWVPNTDQ
nr:hypothetical protein [Tanacetum cinerariifolium]